MKRPVAGKAKKARCEMTCKSDPRQIARVEKFVDRVNRKAHLDDGTMYRLLVATTEAVNNAILHGNKLNPKKLVHVSCELVGCVLKVTVRDHGNGFDPSHLANPLADENLMKENGRGIFLIRSLVDEVDFHLTKGGTSVIMKLDLSKLG